jgi:hypothetical protein
MVNADHIWFDGKATNWPDYRLYLSLRYVEPNHRFRRFRYNRSVLGLSKWVRIFTQSTRVVRDEKLSGGFDLVWRFWPIYH